MRILKYSNPWKKTSIQKNNVQQYHSQLIWLMFFIIYLLHLQSNLIILLKLRVCLDWGGDV